MLCEWNMRLPRLVFEWEPEDRLIRGRPKNTWISDAKMAQLDY